MTPFELADQLVDEMVELDPLAATQLGLPGHNHRWPDFGIEGVEAAADLRGRHLAALKPHLAHRDPWQRLAAVVAHDYLAQLERAYQAGDHFYDVSHMACTFDRVRSTFDIMPTGSLEAWEDICSRLETMDRAFEGYQQRLRQGVALGKVCSVRQVRSVIDQAEHLAGEDSALRHLASRGASAFEQIADRLECAIGRAQEASSELAGFLRREYLPHAPVGDGVGADRYLRAADGVLGLGIDPHEVYEWGWSELGRLRREMVEVGSGILPGASIGEVAELLQTDPDRRAPDRASFVEFVLERQHKAVSELDGRHFDVPEEIREVSVQIAPPGGALGAYYVAPSEDFTTRRGGIWYSMPPEDQPVPLYQEVSTAYHEGFPGHHLQVGLVMTLGDRLSRFHRSMVWYAGYGEGWALYAERLMRELGYLEAPEYEFGMLASHVFRAARVVVDIGCHLDLDIPGDAPLHPGEPWTFERAVDYMHQIGLQPAEYAASEVRRYLGWPAQAISYKVGEREILSLRSTLQSSRPEAFDVKDFHNRLLGHGEMRLDRLRRVMIEGWE